MPLAHQPRLSRLKCHLITSSLGVVQVSFNPICIHSRFSPISPSASPSASPSYRVIIPPRHSRVITLLALALGTLPQSFSIDFRLLTAVSSLFHTSAAMARNPCGTFYHHFLPIVFTDFLCHVASPYARMLNQHSPETVFVTWTLPDDWYVGFFFCSAGFRWLILISFKRTRPSPRSYQTCPMQATVCTTPIAGSQPPHWTHTIQHLARASSSTRFRS